MLDHIPLNNGKNWLHWQNEQYCSGSTYFTEIYRLILFRLRWTSSQWRSNFGMVSEKAIKSNLNIVSVIFEYIYFVIYRWLH